MGWFWGSDSSDQDPYNKLDPKLREFLDKESPVKYQPSPKTASPPPASSQNAMPDHYRAQVGLANSTAAPLDQSHNAAPNSVPPESLYQDGRYAHLWKNYDSVQAAEAASTTDQDRLSDIIDAFNERRAQIGRAAVENCVFEQLEEKACFDRGGFKARMTMCRTEAKAFNRCYTMQSRFLKALGYLSMNRTPDEEEKIQMHADKLYQEMIQREKTAEAAKAAGQPEPDFQPLLNAQSAAEALGVKQPATTTPDRAPAQKSPLDVFSAERRSQIEASLAGKTKAQRDLEIQLVVAESRAGLEYNKKVTEFLEQEKEKRADRRERGKESFGDTLKRLWGWDT